LITPKNNNSNNLQEKLDHNAVAQVQKKCPSLH